MMQSTRPAEWVLLADVPLLPLWPKELRPLCQRLLEKHAPEGSISVLGRLECPLTRAESEPFA
jgi:hypothetical protein